MAICELLKNFVTLHRLYRQIQYEKSKKTFLFEKLYHLLNPKFILPNFISPTDFCIQIFWGR